jgi:hypothetical protein
MEQRVMKIRIKFRSMVEDTIVMKLFKMGNCLSRGEQYVVRAIKVSMEMLSCA